MGVSRDPADRPAPPPLELIRAFVNTLDIDKGTDELSSPGRAARWLRRAGLLAGEVRPEAGACARIVQGREAFRAVLVANADGRSAVNATQVLNDIADSAGIVMRLSGPDSAAPVVTAAGIDAAVGRLLVIAFEAMAAGTWTRLKACPAQTCHWAFYDNSRNRSARWCDMGLCGNRAKRQAFQQRLGPISPLAEES
jgi:predicted RNA-binding Zn ribbon-like protein